MGHVFPVHIEALREGGPAFLTEAFRATGAIDVTNSVVSVSRLESFSGGSTGRKAVLSVAYETAVEGLPDELFVKFSRDPDDDRRDRGRGQMAAEVRFGLLSQIPDFPVAVPKCLFGEYDDESGSGILISERIAFGANGIEPHHPKARDYEIDDPRGHYDALVTALARLAGSHRAGVFPDEAMAQFAPRVKPASTQRQAPTTPEEIRERVVRYANFAQRFPPLLPAQLRTEEFLDTLMREAPRSVEHADALRTVSKDSARDLFAFCHWNANIDNAWFWRDETGALACGLMDWGNVGQINMVTALSSALIFAEPDFLVGNLNLLLARFAEEFGATGGGSLDPAALRLQLDLQVVSGGLRWPLGAVPLIERCIPDDAAVADRFEPLIADDEHARTQLHLLIGYLTLWQAIDAGALIDWAIDRARELDG